MSESFRVSCKAIHRAAKMIKLGSPVHWWRNFIFY